MTSVPPSFEHPGSPPARPELPEGAPAPAATPGAQLPRLGVPWWAPFLVVLFALIAVLLIQTLVAAAVEIGGGDASSIDGSDAATIGFTLVLDVSLVACTVAVASWLAGGRPSAAAFGLRRPDWRSALGWTLAIYASFWVAAIVVGIAFGEPEEQDIVAELKAEDSVLVLAGFGVMTCLIAPLAEEFFFRGFLFRVLAERTSTILAIVVSGSVFGLVHLPSGDWIGAIVLSLFGMTLCVLFVRTASLLPCIMLHAFHNSISFGVTKGLPWWGFLLLVAGSVTTTLAVSLLVTRAGPRGTPAPPPSPS